MSDIFVHNVEQTSEHYKQIVDTKVNNLMSYLYKETVRLLTTYQPQLEKVAIYLNENEVITNEDIDTLLGPEIKDKIIITYS